MSVEKPRFRRDLEVVPVEAEGERYVDVRDPSTGGNFLFYDFEYRVALAFDGLDLERVIPWVKLSTGLELQVDQLRAFAERLQEMGFLEGDTGPAGVALPSTEVLGVPALAAQIEETTPVMAEVPVESVPLPGSEGESVTPAVEMAEAPVAGPADSAGAAEPGAESSEASAPRKEPYAPLAELSPDLIEPSPDVVEPQAEVVAVATAPGVERPAPRADPPHPPRADSTAFPVLAVPAPRVPEAASTSVPPPWSTPRPLMTPTPVTFGPILEQPSARRRLRRSLVLFGSLGVLAAAAVLALALPFLISPQEPSRPRVRAPAVAPGTIFRYFDGAGTVQAAPGPILKFPASGKVTRIASVGSTVAMGDIAASVESARPLQDQLVRQRERLAFYQQMAEAMHQVGNATEEERQVAKVELRNAKIAKTLAALASLAVVVDVPSEVAEILAHEGDVVEAGQPALRLRSAGLRASFELPRPQVALARRLGFCRVEVDGYVFDCTQLQESSQESSQESGQESGQKSVDEGHVNVAMTSVPAALLGKPAHLARARFEGGFVIPADAVVRTGNRDQVFIVSPQSRAEARPVTIAERDATQVIVVQGLDAGDRVVVEAVPGLRAGAQVALVP